ncbi:hypothetical protein EK21DRAFT_111342 [Setomelanomma holmii]|uniref:Pleckstrin homology domain-containing protein n=1 Tax=Setomelanomma holmii TaxID=210430 RepID=A0A9P4HDK1_9PLEO|nr:hypothetical protein EK21DRAFT_111342 [Setomelanomma holmii]
MATNYFSDNEAFISSHPLPSPAGTPYHSVSRRTSRYGTPVSDVRSSPLPLPPDPNMSTEDTANDENISILDPRRFTPTLHANLVSEILSLRRELDFKHRFIEDLETNLHATRGNNETLSQQLASASKDSRNAKRQLQHFETETLAALEEIAGERDKMKEANADLRVKLEATQKKSRSQEEDSTRVHDMWAREKEAWSGEKLALERRVHTSDTRLKIMLDEIALHEAARDEAGNESEADDLLRDGGLGPESDTASIWSSPQRRPSTRLGRHSRNRSNSSFKSIGRNYRMSLMSLEGHGRTNGVCLADELVFDEEEEDLEELELDSDDFPENEMRARRALESRQSMYPDEKAKRILGLSNEHQQADRDEATTVEGSEASKTSYETVHSLITLTPRDIALVFPPTKPIYVDSGVQPSPPPSPTRLAMAEASSQTIDAPLPSKLAEVPSTNAEIEANQRRKRVSAPRGSPSPPPIANLTPSVMTSSSVQTVEQPLSPPDTPKIPYPNAQSPLSPAFKAEIVSTATQTDNPTESIKAESTRAPAPVPIVIPSIAIHAPSSAPSSPKEPILPPGTKTVSTQTSGDLTAPMRSFGMQTEPIRIDQRAIKLPAHLLPSAVTSKPGTPEPSKERSTASGNRKDSHHPSSSETEQPTARLAARQDLTALLEKAADKKVEHRYPGNNDNGPLSKYHQADVLSRPFRTSSLFAGFDGPSSDEDDDDDHISDDDLRSPQFSTPMLSLRNSKNARPFNPPTPVPEDKEAVPSRLSEDSTVSNQMASKRSSIDKPAKVGKPARNSLSRQPSIRRSAMIQNGTAAHVRSRSPSIGSLGSSNYIPKPPFPVPTRSSSRNKPASKSEGSQSPTPRNSGSYAGRRPYGVKHQRKDSLRKVRSAAPVSKPSRSRSRSPTLPATPSIAETSSIPPLPSDVVSASGFGHRNQFSTATAYTANGSINTSASQTSVVDAIAASMIGEFMWKYVRKRKAFGGPDASAEVSRAAEEASLASHGVRHKRWVWISPYEQAILWSSKQPTSGSALMGKSGRKLVIQSVLDVADNCPPPKNETLFNRSILILTPARALKFTTMSRERHYLWLTALSFLAHSNSPIPDLGSMPPPPPAIEEPQQRNQGATLRRSRVQDSVRLAKGKANPVMQRYASQQDIATALPSLAGFDRPIPDSASPPTIPRGPHHGRKRSSTGPSAPPPNVPFRSFSHQHVPSVYSNGSSDMYSAAAPPSVPSSVYNPHSGAISSRTSEASTSTRQHFFDTMGTVRMEAFIDNALGDAKHGGSHAARSRMHSRRRGSSQWSASTRDQTNRAGGFFDDFEVNDPFRGF